MSRREQALQIYRAYPRKVARKYAVACIEKALKDLPFDELLDRVKRYAQFCKDQDQQFVPHPSTWFNQGRYYDIEDDPNCWPAAPEIPVAEAWEMVRHAIRTFGGAKARDKLPALVYDAAKAIGWQRICDMTEYSRSDVYKSFARAYEQGHGRSRETGAGSGGQAEIGDRRGR